MTTSTKSMVAALLCCIATTMGAQAPTLLKDINKTRASSYPQHMTLSGNTVFFSADADVHGRELWKTDVTSDKTVLIKDINPYADSNPDNFCNLNGIVYFTATTLFEGNELWKTDGTPEGTVLVADILPGAAGSKIYSITACNGKVYFGAIQLIGDLEIFKLYVSDGTALGTKVLDFNNELFKPQNLTKVGTTLYFSGSSSTYGTEIWKTNGVSVQLVMDIVPGVGSSIPRNFLDVNGKLFFSAVDSLNGCQLWKTSGTPATTLRVTGVQLFAVVGPDIIEIAHVNGVVFFSAASMFPNLGNQIFKVNSGVAEGATLITVLIAQNLTAFNGKLYFTQTPQIGNPTLSCINANSTLVTNLYEFSATASDGSGIPQNLIAASDKLFFTAGSLEYGRELWQSNGTAAGTVMVKDFTPGAKSSDITDMCIRSTTVFFACTGSDGNELRRSNGIQDGIITVSDIGLAGSNPTGFIKFGNYTYFAADDGINGRELWRTDGTEAGTNLFKSINSGFASASPDHFLVVTNGAISTLFFVADNGTHGRELWKTDGTSIGTKRISDINPGGGDAGINNLVSLNGVLHFTAFGSLAAGDRIYKTNPDLLSVSNPFGVLTNANNLVAIGSTLYFTQSATDVAPKLCKLVGVIVSTIKSFTLIPGGQYPIPQQLIAVGNRLFFTAADAAHGRELWTSTGTNLSTVRISEIMAGSEDASIYYMTNFNGTLHFSAKRVNDIGFRIFKTNAAATAVTTTGGIQENAFNLTVVGASLFFGQYPNLTPDLPSLCKLEAGVTTILKTFDPMPNGQSSGPSHLTAAGNKLFFTATTATTGRELWISDGTAAGTISTSDMRPGIGNAGITTMYMSGANLFLSLNTQSFGQEPYIVANAALMQGDAADNRDAEAEPLATAGDMALDFSVYPNPASHEIFVNFPDNSPPGAISLLNAAGQSLRTVQVEGAKTLRLDLQDLPRGLYLLRWVQQDHSVVVKKVVVQ